MRRRSLRRLAATPFSDIGLLVIFNFRFFFFFCRQTTFVFYISDGRSGERTCRDVVGDGCVDDAKSHFLLSLLPVIYLLIYRPLARRPMKTARCSSADRPTTRRGRDLCVRTVCPAGQRCRRPRPLIYRENHAYEDVVGSFNLHFENRTRTRPETTRSTVNVLRPPVHVCSTVIYNLLPVLNRPTAAKRFRNPLVSVSHSGLTGRYGPCA